MSVNFLRVGTVLILLLSAFAFPAEAQTPAFEITNATQTTFLIDGQTETVDITVRNNHASTTIDGLDIAIPAIANDDGMSIVVATATGWTSNGAADTDDDGQNDEVDLSLGGGSAIAADGGTLTFSLTFQNSAANEGATDDQEIILTITALNAGDSSAFGSDTLSLDMQEAGVTFTSATTVDLDDETSEATGMVVLDAPPRASEDITVTLSSTDTSVVTTSPTSLTFDRTDWSTPQAFTIEAVSDNKDTDDRVGTLSAEATTDRTSGTDGYRTNPIVPTNITVTVSDDDTAALIVRQRDPADTLNDGVTVVYEGSTDDKLSINLATTPTEDTTITITADTTGQLTISPASVTFLANVAPTAQIIDLSAVDDTIASEPLATSVGLTISVDDSDAAPEYDPLSDVLITATVVDDEGVGLTIAETDGDTTVNEAAGSRTDTFTVVLDEEPHKNVVLAVSTGSDEISVLPSQLIFTPADWTTPQTITVTAVDDDSPEDTEVATVDIEVDDGTSSGEYHKVPKEVVTVTVGDDDQPGFALVETGGHTTVDETGATDTVRVRLAKAPASNVVLFVESDDEDEVAIRSGGGVTLTDGVGTLTFTPSNWNVDQTVTVEGVDDEVADGDQDVDVTFSVDPTQSDDRWDATPAQVITVTNKDDEPIVMARPMTVPILEGESGTYELRLSVRPTNDVTVSIDSDLETDKSTVTFTPADWQTPRTITVTVPDDRDADGDRESEITHSVLASGNYDGAPGEIVTIEIEDDDKIDIAEQNRRLQDTVKVSRSGSRNSVTWDISVVEGDPAGVQIWRGDSPFFIIANADNGTTTYRQAKYADDGGTKSSRYLLTVYYGDTEELGFYERGRATLDQVQGYEGITEAEQNDLGAKIADEDNVLLIVGIAVGILLLVVIVVLIIVFTRRKKDDGWEEWDEDWEEPEDAAWESGTEGEGHAELGEHSEHGEHGHEHGEHGHEHAGHAHAEHGEHAEHGHEHGEHAEYPDDWSDAPSYELTCPRCEHDFSVQGYKPFETECPNCGVTGVLR